MRNLPYTFLFVCIAVLSGAGCKPAEQTPAKPVENIWSWEEYPAVEKMRLASLPCRVLPRATITITAPMSGQLKMHVQNSQTNLPAEFLWAEFEPKLYEMEARELAEGRHKIEEKEKLISEIELPKQKIKLEKEISEAERQLALLKILSKNPELADLAVTASSLKSSSVRGQTVEQVEHELALMKQNMEYLAATNTVAIGVDIQGHKMELQRRQLEFERRLAQSHLKMPFRGQLITSLQISQGVTEYPVSAGQELAVVRDMNAILLRVPLSDVSWTALPTEKLSAVVHLADGTSLRALYSYKKLERFQFREEVFSYFEFAPEDAGSAAALAGTDLTCELWVDLEQPARVVPKLKLVLHQPEKFENRHWNEAVAQMLPGSHVILEGQTELAILPPIVDGQPVANAKRTSHAHAK